MLIAPYPRTIPTHRELRVRPCRAPELTLRPPPTLSLAFDRSPPRCSQSLIEGSPWPQWQVPTGWGRTWSVPAGESASSAAAASAALAAGSSGEQHAIMELPILVYVSSLSGDRRAFKNCRWTLDFLLGKKVPHAIIDLSVHPEMRSRIEAMLPGAPTAADASAAPPLTSRSSVDDAVTSGLPVVDVGGLRTFSHYEMQDLEDHGELDPLLSQAIKAYAGVCCAKAKAAT